MSLSDRTFSKDELAFQNALADEFPDGAAVWDDAVSRRNFLQLMGASLALAGLVGCERRVPPAEIVPYTTAPEQTLPGRPTYFTSTMPFDGYGRGVLVISREGRPIKIEGNPDHPASLGGTDVFMQASVLDLYDPDRARSVTQAGVSRPVSAFHAELESRLTASVDGRGVRLLTRNITSPTLAAQLKEFARRYPLAKWHVHDPAEGPRTGAQTAAAFTEPTSVVYDLSGAQVVASLDCDFLFSEPLSLRYARQFSDGRRVRKDRLSMTRTYVAESALSLTGSMADHRLPLKPTAMLELARALAAAVGVEGAIPAATLPPAAQRWVDALASDLKRAGSGASVVMPGRFQPAEVHAQAHAINRHLGNDGATVRCIEPAALQGAAPWKELMADLHGGAVSTLLILDGNPAYDTAADAGFAAALRQLTQQVTGGSYSAFTAHLSTHFNETSFCCQWHVPMAHWLESWGDLRAADGTASLVQPLIAPLYDGVSPWEFVEALLGRPDRGGFDILRDYWKGQVATGFEAWWLATLQNGVVAGTTATPRPMPALATAALAASPPAPNPGALELVFRPDPSVWAGDFANNAWLAELPKPFTKLTWDNAIGVGVLLAKSLGVGDGDVVALAVGGRSVEGPVIVVPGQADGVVTLSLGYGRSRGGQLLTDNGTPRGINAYALRSVGSPWSVAGAELKVTGRSTKLATAQNHHAMSVDASAAGSEPFLEPSVVARLGMSSEELALRDRKLIRTVTLEQYQNNPRFMDTLAPEEKKPLLSLFPGVPKAADLQWGMVIDTTACMGCNACVIACQAENNIPVVGKAEVINEREMHWIRIDDYFDGPTENPSVYHQPVPCMHCEDAPCEVVCPVGATTHSPEGINEMTYNRCVGTRFCSNNCPYKVRRFNFLLYSDYQKDSRSLQYNPDVSVRSRGVMEKCTYCIQRIDRTRIEMQKETNELRELADEAEIDADRQRLSGLADARGAEVVNRLETACQQSCPTRAISFGNIADPAAEVTRQKTEPANYVLLRSLTTKPRTSYLARVTNPSPSWSVALTSSAGMRGEDGGGGDFERRTPLVARNHPHPLPEYRARGPEGGHA